MSPIGTSNRTALRYVAESVLGTTPATPQLDAIRYTGEGLNYNLSNIKSEEIVADRMTADLVQVSSDAAGNIDFELTYDTFDAFIVAVMAASAWSTDINISGSDISAANTDASFNATTTDLSTNIVPGQWIKTSSFSNSANNGYWKVNTVTSTKITVFNGSSIVDESAGSPRNIDGSMIRNGTTLKSFTIQKHIQDITTPVFFNFTGSCINEMSLNFETGQILKGSFGVMALDGNSTTTQFSGATTPAANTNTPMNAVSNLLDIQQDNATLSQYIQSLTMTVNNNIRAQDAIGNLAHIGLVLSRLEVSGNMNIYFDDATMFTKYRNATSFSYSFRCQDLDGNAYIMTFPNVKFETGQVVSGGLDQDMVFNATWQAIKHGTYNCMIQIDKFDA